MAIYTPSQKQNFTCWGAKAGGLIKRDIPKYPNCVICRLMNGSCLENYRFPCLQVRKPAYWIKVSPVCLGLN